MLITATFELSVWLLCTFIPLISVRLLGWFRLEFCALKSEYSWFRRLLFTLRPRRRNACMLHILHMSCVKSWHVPFGLTVNLGSLSYCIYFFYKTTSTLEVFALLWATFRVSFSLVLWSISFVHSTLHSHGKVRGAGWGHHPEALTGQIPVSLCLPVGARSISHSVRSVLACLLHCWWDNAVLPCGDMLLTSITFSFVLRLSGVVFGFVSALAVIFDQWNGSLTGTAHDLQEILFLWAQCPFSWRKWCGKRTWSIFLRESTRRKKIKRHTLKKKKKKKKKKKIKKRSYEFCTDNK